MDDVHVQIISKTLVLCDHAAFGQDCPYVRDAALEFLGILGGQETAPGPAAWYLQKSRGQERRDLANQVLELNDRLLADLLVGREPVQRKPGLVPIDGPGIQHKGIGIEHRDRVLIEGRRKTKLLDDLQLVVEACAYTVTHLDDWLRVKEEWSTPLNWYLSLRENNE